MQGIDSMALGVHQPTRLVRMNARDVSVSHAIIYAQFVFLLLANRLAAPVVLMLSVSCLRVTATNKKSF